MLCFAIACVHVLSVKVYQNRHLEVVWIARYFFY